MAIKATHIFREQASPSSRRTVLLARVIERDPERGCRVFVIDCRKWDDGIHYIDDVWNAALQRLYARLERHNYPKPYRAYRMEDLDMRGCRQSPGLPSISRAGWDTAHPAHSVNNYRP